MSHTPTATSLSEDVYLSDIITGAHGDQYQKDLALVIFERATRKGYDFRLGYEMAIADKFDDMAYFNKSTNTWTLIQTKHADTSKGKSPLKYDMLFPADEASRKNGDFSLFKYFKSYVTIVSNIKERKNVIIFTNRDFLASLEQSIEVEPRIVDEILIFDRGNCNGLIVKDNLIKEMLDYVNRDFTSLRNSIIKLFNEGVMDQVIKDFKTPVANILSKSKTCAKFSENFSPEARQMITSLSSVINIQTAQLPLDKCRDVFSGNSRNKTFPLFANEDTVHQFFRDLVLFVGQPDNLRVNLHHDMYTWMRTWIRPDYLTRLEESQLEMNTVSLDKFFDGKQSRVEVVNERRYYKTFLQLTDGKEFFGSLEKELTKQIQKPSNGNVNHVNYYISRQIVCTETAYDISNVKCGNNSDGEAKNDTVRDENRSRVNDVKLIMRDNEFVNELPGKLSNQRFMLLIAEPGMGKSTILEFIALAAQQKSSDCVYFFKLNTFNRQLSQIKNTNECNELLAIFGAVLSERTFDILQETIRGKVSGTKHFMIFDAFDEVIPQNRHKVLKLFKLMLESTNVQILVSSRKTVKTLLENEFNVETMSLVPFDIQNQRNFLRKFWNVSEENDSSFHKYVTCLFQLFDANVNRALCEITGIPLMLKMLAEVYADHFKDHIKLGQNNLEDMMSEKMISAINLYEQFIKKCFANKMMKKFNHLYSDTEDEYDRFLFEMFTLEHQLLAIKRLQVRSLQSVFNDANHLEKFNEFEERIICGIERSPLIEVVENESRFIHLSYAEFLVAKFLFWNIEKYETEIFGADSKADLFHIHPSIRVFFFALIELHNGTNAIKILERHYKTNCNIALWACEAHGQKTVEFLLRTVYDSTIINNLLGKAAQHNCYKMCSYLFKNHKVINDYKIDGYTPLCIAAKQGHEGIVKLLLENSANVNWKNINGWTPLHIATINGHSCVVKLLIDHGGDVNATIKDGSTSLHIAARSGYIEIVKMLIDHCRDVNAIQKQGWTAIHLAAQNGHSDVVEILILHCGDVNAKEIDSWTPLHIAAQNGHSLVVKMLIDHGGDISAKTNRDFTPLYIAARNGHLEVAKILIDNCRAVSLNINKLSAPLRIAAHNGHSDLVKLLTDQCEDVNAKQSDSWTSLHIAAQNGNMEVVKMLIDHGGDVNAKSNENFTPLHIAARNGHSEVVKILIEHCEDVDAKSNEGYTPLHIASQNGHSEVVKILMDRCKVETAKTNKVPTPICIAAYNGHSAVVKMLINHFGYNNEQEVDSWTSLHIAAQNGHSKVVKILIDHIEDVDVKEIDGWTPLHIAAHNGHSEVVKALIDRCADVNLRTNRDYTPLYLAARNGHSDVVNILLDHCEDVNAKEINSWTPLHIAAENGYSKVVKSLINHGADVNAVMIDGWTPLHIAAHKGHLEVVKMLIDHCGNISVKNNDGLTPLDMAVQNKHFDVAKILTESFKKH